MGKRVSLIMLTSLCVTCASPPPTDQFIGPTAVRTSVTFCNYYKGQCTSFGQVTEMVRLADGTTVMRSYPVCNTPGVVPLCDEKYGCQVCFDPITAGNNELNQSQICAVGCRDQFIDGMSGGNVPTSGAFDCAFSSRPNVNTDSHNPLVQDNKCEAGLPTGAIDTTQENANLIAKIPLGVDLNSSFHVRAEPASLGPIERSGTALQGRISLTRQGCAGGSCGYFLDLFSVNLPPATFPLLIGQSSGEDVIPLVTIDGIELKTRDPVLITADAAGRFSIPAGATFFVARFNVNGAPRVVGVRLPQPVTGTIDPGRRIFRLTGQVRFVVPGVGLDGTSVPVTVTYDVGGTYIDSDGDGIPDANDSCPLIAGQGAQLLPLRFTSLPPDVTVGACASPTIPAPTATGNCWVSIGNDMPARLPLGTTVVTWTARDAAGQVIRHRQRVTAVMADDASCCPAGTNVISGTPNNDFLTGTAGADCIVGRGGQDVIFGGGGDDVISGGEGNDEIHGENGNDRIDGGGGQDVLFGDAGNDNVSGGAGDDRLFGGIGTDTLQGGEGQDQLAGEAGNDQLFGNAGDDRLTGGDGSDVCNGGGLHDTYQTCETIQ